MPYKKRNQMKKYMEIMLIECLLVNKANDFIGTVGEWGFLFPCLKKERSIYMNNEQYNKERHNRKKQLYRLTLGIQQFLNCPIINLVWFLFAIGVIYFMKWEQFLVSRFEIPALLGRVFNGCMKFLEVFFPMMCAVGIIQFLGYITAMKDEADLCIIFSDKRNAISQPPILKYKKKDKKTGVIKREFYTTIPMEQWQEKKEAICDRLDVHLIGDISYGGRKKNKGNHIYFESVKGRNPKERGVLYDDTF